MRADMEFSNDRSKCHISSHPFKTCSQYIVMKFHIIITTFFFISDHVVKWGVVIEIKHVKIIKGPDQISI